MVLGDMEVDPMYILYKIFGTLGSMASNFKVNSLGKSIALG